MSPVFFDQCPIQQERKREKLQSGDSPNITGALQKEPTFSRTYSCKILSRYGFPLGINRFKKVNRLILSRYSGGTGVYNRSR